MFQIPREWLALLRVGGALLFGASVMIALMFTMFLRLDCIKNIRGPRVGELK